LPHQILGVLIERSRGVVTRPSFDYLDVVLPDEIVHAANERRKMQLKRCLGAVAEKSDFA